MTTYKHRQPATLTIGILGAASVVVIGIAFTATKAVLVAVPILLFAAWLFHSLTIEILDGTLHWYFGSGLIHKQVPVAEIESARLVRTNILEGWGIHWSRFGWLYNVSGFSAVAVKLRNGKRFALGTDEPEALVAALQSARAA